MKLVMQKLSPEEWRHVSEVTHLVTFNEQRPAHLDNIDYALILQEETEGGLVPCGYLTARDLDSDSVYWQFGGGFPGTRESTKAVECYSHFLEWTKERYKRITTLVENTNVRYLKLAMHFGFRIIGMRTFNGTILIELLNDLTVKT